MPIELKQHYVAFLDILGFTEMVNSDTNGEDQSNLLKLYKCHQSLSHIFNDHPDCTITQFSDSVVIAKPYAAQHFDWFVEKVANYQRLLIDEHLLCRGGIAVNKHYSNNNFTFSAGLISAYNIESKFAKYPRVVVSQDVLDLVYPDSAEIPKFLLKEDDGLYFVDYLGSTSKKKPKTLAKSVNHIISTLVNSDLASVREKGRWLAAYSDASLRTNHSAPKFVGRNSKYTQSVS